MKKEEGNIHAWRINNQDNFVLNSTKTALPFCNGIPVRNFPLFSSFFITVDGRAEKSNSTGKGGTPVLFLLQIISKGWSAYLKSPMTQKY